jgi:hypothetical protein
VTAVIGKPKIVLPMIHTDVRRSRKDEFICGDLRKSAAVGDSDHRITRPRAITRSFLTKKTMQLSKIFFVFPKKQV